MKRFSKKAFTIVELVIVIAVIAVLAAVLIPTFTSIVNNANKSADLQEATSINIQLAMKDDVTSLQDVYDVIDETFGQAKSNEFTPRSADQGYHYWYDASENVILLKTHQEIEEMVTARLSLDQGVSTFARTYAQSKNAFSNANSFREIIENFHILDKVGVIGEMFTAIETGAVDLKTKVEQLANVGAEYKAVAQKIVGKLEKTIVVGNNITYVYNSDKAENIYFVPNTTTITNNVVIVNGGEYIAKAEKVSNISLPASVEKIEEGALMFDLDKQVNINTLFESAQKITEVFQANSTNANILIQNSESFYLEGAKVKDENGNDAGMLEFGNPVQSFNIVTPADTDYYQTLGETNKIIYVAYNYAGEIALGVDNFVGANNPATVSSKEVTWQSSNDLFKISADGKITLDGAPVLGASATITATAVAGGVSKTVQVYLDMPMQATFSLAGLNLDMVIDEDAPTQSIAINYTGKDGESFNFNNFNVSWNPGVVVGDNNIEVIDNEDGNVFSIDYSDELSCYVLTLLRPTNCKGETQTFTVKIGSALIKTFELSVNDISAEEFAVKTIFADAEFLYRVGNANAVTLNTFFINERPEETFTLSILDVIKSGSIGVDSNFTATVDGQSSANGEWELTRDAWLDTENPIKIQFNGTGVAKIQIGEVFVTVEVVNAKNVFTYADLNGSTNNVLLSDIELPDNGRFGLQGTTLYGNDFTFDVTKGNYTAVRYDGYSAVSDNYRVYLNNATLDNVRIVGNSFSSYGAVASSPDNICNVLSNGNSKIVNSFISYCAAPVRVTGGNLEVVNTTLKGGSIANLDVRGGNVTLDNVTTINQKSVDGKVVCEGAVGFGVMFWYEGVDATATITIKNKLTQYNYLSESDFRDIQAVGLEDKVADAIFNSNSGTKDFIYTDNSGTKWVNTGIFSMTSEVGQNNVKNQLMTNSGEYAGSNVSYAFLGTTYNGYLFSKTASNVKLENPSDYASMGQGEILPSFTFDLGSNKENKVDGSDNYCYIENGIVKISFNYGESKQFSLDGLCSAIKGDKNLTLVETKLNGASVNGSITFDASNVGDHEITFVFDDQFNYDKDGNSIIKQRSYTIKLSVIEAQPDAKNAEFTFKTNTTTEKITINSKTYISAVGVSATDQQWGYITVSGQKVFYPIIEASIKKNTFGTEAQAFYYVFNGVVTITDYKDKGLGEAQTFDKSTTTMPSNLTVVNGIEAKYESINSACVDISKLNKDGPSGEVWDWSASSTISTTTKHNGYLAHQSPSGLAIKTGSRDYNAITVAQFSYTDNAGETYYYFAGYYMPNQVSGGSSGGGGAPDICVTPDTLVTLADGTNKEIQHVTYEDKLLVWDFYKGEYTVVNSSIIMNHGYSKYTIVTLNFADGTSIKTINGHGFFDVATNKYVIIDKDNVADYIGHEFVKVDGDGYSTTKLVGFSISEEYTESWSILTQEHYNCILEGMWTLTPAEVEGSSNYLMPYEIVGMKYDAEKMLEDIEKYGLYTYEDFSEYITVEQFNAFGLANFKVAVGKGYITFDDILFLIGLHC